MPIYSVNDKRDFFEKDARTNISILVQSAFNKAVDTVIAQGLEGKTISQILQQVVDFRDRFFQDNQKKIEEEIQKFLELNPVSDWYEEQKQKAEDVEKAVTPTIGGDSEAPF